MSVDRQTKLSSLVIPDGGYAIPGFHTASVGICSYIGTAPNGGSVIQCEDQTIIDNILQGQLLFEDPATFGGISSDGDTVVAGQYGVTTWMPNQNAPIIDVVYCEGVGIWKIRQIVDSSTIIVEDPAQLATSLSGASIKATCSKFSPPTMLQFSGNSSMGMFCLDGTTVSTGIIFPHEITSEDGMSIEPFMVISTGSDIIVNISY